MGREKPSSRQVARAEKLVEVLRKYEVDLSNVVDFGIEHGWTAKALRDSFDVGRLTGVEIWPEFARLARKRGWYDRVIEGDALEWLSVGLDFSTVIANDFIEHLTRRDGLEFLSYFERSADFIVVTTPIGFVEQRALEGNPYEEHRSGWTPEEFEAMGWTVEHVDQERNYFLATYRRLN